MRLHEALYKWLTCTYILPQSGRSRYECDHMRRRRVCRTEWLEFCTSSSETLVHVSHGRAYDGNPLCQQGGLPSIESRGDTCLGRCCVDLHKAKRSPCGRINKGACGAHPLHQQEPCLYVVGRSDRFGLCIPEHLQFEPLSRIRMRIRHSCLDPPQRRLDHRCRHGRPQRGVRLDVSLTQLQRPLRYTQARLLQYCIDAGSKRIEPVCLRMLEGRIELQRLCPQHDMDNWHLIDNVAGWLVEHRGK